MTLEIIESTAPSHWASAVINGDYSGMEDSDIAQCDGWLDWVDCGAPVSCDDAGFMRYHDAAQFGVLASDCQTYVFHKMESSQ